MIAAYQRAKFSAIKIIGQKITGGVNTNLMMNTVSQTIPSHQLCSSCVSKRQSIDESLPSESGDRLSVTQTRGETSGEKHISRQD